MAKFKTASIFSNHMVLQREKNIRVFGQGENGKTIQVTLGENQVSTVVELDSWMVILPPMKATVGMLMRIVCEDRELQFSNIAIGEVWLAGGQSNMELELQNAKEGEEVIKSEKEPNVRFYYTPKNSYKDDHFYEDENHSCWSEWSQESAKSWSAVGYFFGRKLAKDLGVTVGVIGCNWGGTSASAWMSRESLLEDRDLNTYLLEYDDSIRGKSIQKQVEEYDEYSVYAKVWDEKCEVLYKEFPNLSFLEVQEKIGACRWPGPLNCKSPYRPAGLYECMIQRISPYSMRGVLWYQGESDDHKKDMYYKLFFKLISQWREEWQDVELPFLFVQLPMHRYLEDKDNKSWCYLREAQMDVFKTTKNTGIAVILDCGEFNEIHPKDKKPVGERLELQALYHVYKKINEKNAFGPIYKEAIFYNDKIELSFDYAEDGFEIKGETKEFEIAGANKEFKVAEIEIKNNKILVFAKGIKNPMYVRYCWTNYGNVTIYGKNGIPLSPFRTSKKDDLLPSNC